jgi:hypothetical protein
VVKRAAIGAALLLLGGCGSSKPIVPPEPVAPLEISERANGQTLRLAVGQELTLTLSECGSCASKWTVTERPPGLAELAKADLGSGDGEPADGGSATVQFLFHADRAGSGRLALRKAAGPGPDGPTLTFNVAVR